MGSPSRRTRERTWVPGIQRCISSIPEVTSSSSSRADAPDFSCHKRTERYILKTFNSQNVAYSHYIQIKTAFWDFYCAPLYAGKCSLYRFERIMAGLLT